MDALSKHSFGNYEEFLSTLKLAGYTFVEFRNLNNPLNQIALRHDVDFDTQLAFECAAIERSLGVSSTYFFLLRSHFYNVYSPQDHANIQRIRDLGHVISIHFDPLPYDDIHAGLRWEVKVFAELFRTNVQIVSLHRPAPIFLNRDTPIANIEHTYQSKYFSNVKYFSDSQGIWRHGNPLESEEFRLRKSLHLLIHPIWWMTHADSNHEKLILQFSRRVETLKGEFAANCLPFRDIYDKV